MRSDGGLNLGVIKMKESVVTTRLPKLLLNDDIVPARGGHASYAAVKVSLWSTFSFSSLLDMRVVASGRQLAVE